MTEKKIKKQPFVRTARITGYLVGSVKRWNPGKRAELQDRTKHMSVNKPVEDK